MYLPVVIKLFPHLPKGISHELIGAGTDYFTSIYDRQEIFERGKTIDGSTLTADDKPRPTRDGFLNYVRSKGVGCTKAQYATVRKLLIQDDIFEFVGAVRSTRQRVKLGFCHPDNWWNQRPANMKEQREARRLKNEWLESRRKIAREMYGRSSED